MPRIVAEPAYNNNNNKGKCTHSAADIVAFLRVFSCNVTHLYYRPRSSTEDSLHSMNGIIVFTEGDIAIRYVSSEIHREAN